MHRADNWPTLVASRSAYLESVMIDEDTRAAKVWPTVFKEQTTDQYAVEWEEIAGFGLHQAIAGERPDAWPLDELTRMWGKRMTTVWRGLGAEFTKPFIMNDKDGLQMAAKGRELIQAGHATEEYWAADIINNQTSTGAEYLLPDGKALAANDHPLRDNVLGGAATVDNYLGVTPAEDSIIDAMVMMDTIPNHRGIPTPYRASRIVCHPALAPRFRMLLNTFQKPDTAENNRNMVRDYNLDVVPWHYLDSATKWGVQSNKHGFVMLVRQALQSETWRSNGDKVIHADADSFFQPHANSWRGWIGGNN